MGNGKRSEVLNRPGHADLHYFEVNGHTFGIRPRTIGDTIAIRGYAMNQLTMHTSPANAVALIDSGGMEYWLARMATLLIEAPEHWKTREKETNIKIIDPYKFNFDSEEFDEVMEVNKEINDFLNKFRTSKLRKELANLQAGGGKGDVEDPEESPKSSAMENPE